MIWNKKGDLGKVKKKKNIKKIIESERDKTLQMVLGQVNIPAGSDL